MSNPIAALALAAVAATLLAAPAARAEDAVCRDIAAKWAAAQSDPNARPSVPLLLAAADNDCAAVVETLLSSGFSTDV